MKKIYLDNAATTPVSKKVLEKAAQFATKIYGNPSSVHELGEKALNAVNVSRKIIARELNCNSDEIIFTSGGTESNNLAIQGMARAFPEKKKILISAIEHASVSKTCDFLAGNGYEIIKIPVSSEGVADFQFIEKQLFNNRRKILLLSIIHVNNVIGVIQDIKKISSLCKKFGVIFHTDAVQSFGKLKIDVNNIKIDLLSASAHKIGGMKGSGILFVRRGTKISPLIFGGGQEKNLRSGTENVPAIVSFAAALEESLKSNKKKIKYIQDFLISELEKRGGKINGSKEKRIYNNVHVSFPNISGENLVLALSQKGIYVSSGSACDSRNDKESDVLLAIGLNKKTARSSIRITLSENTTESEVKTLVKEIQNNLNRIL